MDVGRHTNSWNNCFKTRIEALRPLSNRRKLLAIHAEEN